MPRKVPLPESALASESWPNTDEQDLALFLEMHEAEFRADPRNILPAFEALASVVAYHRRNPNPEKKDTIALPWWAAEALSLRYCDYRDSAMSLAPKTLGEAYRIEGHGQ